MRNQEPLPKGILYNSIGKELEIIVYKRVFILMVLFLFVWISFWSYGCIKLLESYLNEGRMNDGTPIQLWFVSLFWLTDLLGIFVLLSELFLVKKIILQPYCLVVKTKIGFLNWEKSYKLSEILNIGICYDVEANANRKWSLFLYNSKRNYIIGSLSYKRAAWIARQIQLWTDLEVIKTN